jgi:hypothetical protein
MQSVIASTLILVIFWLTGRYSRRMNAERKSHQEVHRIEMLEERNYQLYYFQLRLIQRLGCEVIGAMPDYKEILYSDKPLEAKYWVDIDKLVNLN